LNMKKMLFRAGVLTGVLAAFLAAPAHSQTPRYRKYVALGDSLTAAVEGNCLVRRHQERSYPKRVADALGISDFQQPLISERAVSGPTGVCLGAVVAGGTITVGADPPQLPGRPVRGEERRRGGDAPSTGHRQCVDRSQ
jgi:hypothetical protein